MSQTKQITSDEYSYQVDSCETMLTELEQEKPNELLDNVLYFRFHCEIFAAKTAVQGIRSELMFKLIVYTHSKLESIQYMLHSPVSNKEMACCFPQQLY